MLPEPFRSVFLPIYSEGRVTSSTTPDSSSASGVDCVPFGIACSAIRVWHWCAASGAVWPRFAIRSPARPSRKSWRETFDEGRSRTVCRSLETCLILIFEDQNGVKALE